MLTEEHRLDRVVRLTIDVGQLEQHVYGFRYESRDNTMRFMEYEELSRSTTRHKFRLNRSRRWYSNRQSESTIRERPEVSPGVRDAALQEYRKRLRGLADTIALQLDET